MAGFGVALILQVLCVLPHGSFAATLNSERDSDRAVLLRREVSSSRLSMAPGGAFVQAAPKKKTVPEETLQDQVAFGQQDFAALKMEFCGYDFPLGKDGTFDCMYTNHSLILEESMCIEAAHLAGANMLDSPLYKTSHHVNAPTDIPEDYSRPLGCYKDPCKDGKTGVCYYFNDNGDPTNVWKTHYPNATIVGTPVCSRSMYLNSTTPDASNGVAGGGDPDTNSGCPDLYSVVDDEDFCETAANCLGDAAGTEFRIGNNNMSEHLDYPRGCFIHNVDHKVYYNSKTVMGIGTTVKGTLICNVSSTVLNLNGAGGGDAAVAAGATNGTAGVANAAATAAAATTAAPDGDAAAATTAAPDAATTAAA